MERDKENSGVELFAPLTIYRSWILLGSVLLAVVVLLFKVLSPTEYRASVVLAPTNSKLSDQFGQLSGLANLAGINLKQDQGASDFDSFTYLASSSELAAWQIRHRPILGLLYDEWDESKNAWQPPSVVGRALAAVLGPRRTPTPFDVERVYDQHVTILTIPSIQSKGEQTGLITINYQDEDPAVATTMLRYIVADANEILRNRAAVRANNQASYLKRQLETITVQEYRDVLLRLLSQQEQILMLAHANLPYAAAPLSGMDLPAERVPKRTVLMTLLAAAIGFCLSYFFAVLHFNITWSRQDAVALDAYQRVPVLPVIRRWLPGRFVRATATPSYREPDEESQLESTM